MRDLEMEIISELDGIAEDLNPTPEPEANVSDTREVTEQVVTKKSTRRK